MAPEKLRHDKMGTERALYMLLSHDKSAEFQYENAVSQVTINDYTAMLYSNIIQQCYITAILYAILYSNVIYTAIIYSNVIMYMLYSNII